MQNEVYAIFMISVGLNGFCDISVFVFILFPFISFSFLKKYFFNFFFCFDFFFMLCVPCHMCAVSYVCHATCVSCHTSVMPHVYHVTCLPCHVCHVICLPCHMYNPTCVPCHICHATYVAWHVWVKDNDQVPRSVTKLLNCRVIPCSNKKIPHWESSLHLRKKLLFKTNHKSSFSMQGTTVISLEYPVFHSQTPAQCQYHKYVFTSTCYRVHQSR